MPNPINPRPILRRAIDQHVKDASALESFFLNYFDAVARDVGMGMDRMAQVNLLFRRESEADIQSALEQWLGNNEQAIAKLRAELGQTPAANPAPATELTPAARQTPAPESTFATRQNRATETTSATRQSRATELTPATGQAADQMAPLLFFEYADADRALVDELSLQLNQLEQSGRLRIFHRGKILPGADLRTAAEDQLAQAAVLVPLISPDFVASARFQPFVDRALALTGRRIIPLLARPVMWDKTALGALAPLPADGRFLSSRGRIEREQTLFEIAQALARATEEQPASARLPTPAPPATPAPRNPRAVPVETPSSSERPLIEVATELALPTSYVLHLSDLHFSSSRQVVPWLDFLEADLKQIRRDVPRIDAVVVSGDVTQVAAPAEFAAAAKFLRGLQETYKLKEHQFVLVPGNHDGDWKTSQLAYSRPDAPATSETPSLPAGADPAEKRGFEELYQQRFAAFADFFKTVCGQTYPLDLDSQATLHPFAEQQLLFVGLNSAWECDHVKENRGRATINSHALASARRTLRNDDKYNGWLKIAVWHHPTQSDGEDRLKNLGFLDRLAQEEFRLGLHGHLHAAQSSQHAYDVTVGGRRINVVGAGTFGAPTKDWRSGVPLQYQILRISGAQVRVVSRCRDNPEGPWRGDGRWVAGAEARTYYDISL